MLSREMPLGFFFTENVLLCITQSYGVPTEFMIKVPYHRIQCITNVTYNDFGRIYIQNNGKPNCHSTHAMLLQCAANLFLNCFILGTNERASFLIASMLGHGGCSSTIPLVFASVATFLILFLKMHCCQKRIQTFRRYDNVFACSHTYSVYTFFLEILLQLVLVYCCISICTTLQVVITVLAFSVILIITYLEFSLNCNQHMLSLTLQ